MPQTPEIIASGDFWTLYDSGLLDIYCNGDMPDYDAGYTYAPWYDYRSQIVSATIGNSVTSVGGAAFYHCAALASVTIPDGVTSIGDYAFDECTSLTSVTIPDSVTSIGGAAFRDCSRLTDAAIPGAGGVSNIGKQAFRGCAALASVTIPDGVTVIGFATFYECGNLSSVTMPNRVVSVGRSAFYRCRRLASVAMPLSVMSIGKYAFDGCESLEDVYYGGTETQWGDIEIGDYNNALTSAAIHYTEAPTPTPTPEPEPGPAVAGRIVYTGRSKPIIRLVEAVNALTAAFAVTDAQIEQAVADAYDAAFEEGDEQDDNDG